MAQERVVALTTKKSIDVNATGRKILLTDTDVHSLGKVLFELRTKPGHFALGRLTSLLVTSFATTTTTTASTLRLIKLVTVILNTKIIGRSAEPVVLGVDLLFGNSGVGNSLGESHAGAEASNHSAINIERLERNLLARSVGVVGLLRLLGVDLASETGNTDNLVRSTDQNTLSGLTGTSSTARSVNVGVCCAGNVVVDDAINALDIQTTSGHVGGDKN